jgi:hypothetical protein
MAPLTTRPEIPGIPSDLVDAVASQAESNAELVVAFLGAIGLCATPGRPIALPRRFLLDLGAALRLLEWERLGLEAHVDASLPVASAALAAAFRASDDGPDEDPGLAKQVMGLFIERFAWHGHRDWDAAVSLGPLDDDAALDALAEFLYRHRHAGAARRPLNEPQRHP